jgi:hypothetical protein
MYGSSPLELLAADAMLRGTINCNSFTYNADFLTGTASALGANGTVNVPIQITSEADFVCQQLMVTAWGAAAGTLLQDPDFTLNIAISSGRPWFNAPVIVRNIAGSYAAAENPDTLPFPRLIPLNSTLTVTLVNRTATAANFVQVLLIGFNVYYQTETRAQVFHTL